MRELIRQVLQGYQSLKLEGQDAGYVLFSGQDPESRQDVLIKVLPRLLGDNPQIADRFNRLARAIRQLNHPNIATIEKVGEEAGLPYIVTQVIQKAQPLAAKLDQPWAVDTAADVVMQVGQALEHAYRKGVVHGSLSPTNVIVQDNGQVEVEDFGLAEFQDLVGVHLQEGASPYLAPERLSGQQTNARADVYSMGALLYSLLTKQAPANMQSEVLPPSYLNPEVSSEMDRVVLKALETDPADRYPDAKALMAALGSVMLVPARAVEKPAAASDRCPKCGAGNQSGRFCRKCGARLQQEHAPAARPKAAAAEPPPRLPKSILDEPIQVTTVEVQHQHVGEKKEIELGVGQGVKVHETSIAQPMLVATGDVQEMFPDPLPMPAAASLDSWPAQSEAPVLAMPEPPAMPVIDWAEIAPEMPKVPSIESLPSMDELDPGEDD